MSDITIQLPDSRMRQLQTWHKTRVEEWLTAPSPEFLKAAQFVLKKNEDLYRKLV